MQKGKVTKGGNVRSYAKQQSDKLRNIRRRYEREAAKFRKQAANAVGITKENLEQAAQRSLEQANRYRADKILGKTKAGTAEAAAKIEAALGREAGASERTLDFGRKTEDAQKDQVARSLLRGNTGSQFYAATKDIWKGARTPEERNELIKKHFGTSNLLDAVNKLSADTGTDFTMNSDATKRGEEYQKKSRRGMLAVAKTRR